MFISFLCIILYFFVMEFEEDIINCNMTSVICVGKINDNLVGSAL